MLAVYIEKNRFETKITTSVIIVGRNRLYAVGLSNTLNVYQYDGLKIILIKLSNNVFIFDRF